MKRIKPAKPEPEVTVRMRNVATGTMHSIGTHVGLLLSIEYKNLRIPILSDVMHELGITPEQVADYYYATACDRCGSRTSPLYPCECGATK